MQRPSILIISDDARFPHVITSRCTPELNSLSFSIFGSADKHSVDGLRFDLAILGHIESNALESLAGYLPTRKIPMILVSQGDREPPRHSGICVLREAEGWPDTLLVLIQEMLQRQRVQSELERVKYANTQLGREASLGRYVLEARHNLNNALTSILGNSDLILLEQVPGSGPLRSQVETIRNMALRMNEILQRFSSLQNEMQLIEQHSVNAAKATAGV